MTPYTGDVAKSVFIGDMHFMLKGNDRLYSLGDVKWRTQGTSAWNRASLGCNFYLGSGYRFEISSLSCDDVYLISQEGYEKIAPKSIKTMIEDILEKVKVIEYRDGQVFAITMSDEVLIGCKDILVLLGSQHMLKLIHESMHRALYEVKMTDEFSSDKFEKYRYEIAGIRERVMKNG